MDASRRIRKMLASHYYTGKVEAGCDEAGRGCLAGSVYAAAVIFPEDYQNDELNDSKQLTDKRRKLLREIIQRDAVAWAVGIVTPEEIDRINILNASILAMHRALDQLQVRPEAIIVDGNRFKPYAPPLFGGGRGEALPHTTIVKGDGKYLSIAAASILAKIRSTTGCRTRAIPPRSTEKQYGSMALRHTTVRLLTCWATASCR